MIHIHDNAVLDDKQKQVVFNIQPFTVGLDLEITRGHSTPLQQLNLIELYARKERCLFTEFVMGDVHAIAEIWIDGIQRKLYAWQQTWSMLLHRGIIINPPLVAECLFDYTNAAGHNKKGELIQPSPHIKDVPTAEQLATGEYVICPIDFSQKVNGVPNIQLAARILTQAKAAGAGLRYVKLEPHNGCVHCDLEQI